MKTPSYVPSAVEKYLTNLIEGNGTHLGIASCLENAKKRLDEIKHEMAAHSQGGQDQYLDELRRERVQVVGRCDKLKAELECLRRLLDAEGMRGAYALLIPEFREERQWIEFFHAARAANNDYAKYRDRLARAKTLTEEIAGAAADLAKLLRDYENTGVNGPPEFFSTRALLRNTEGRSNNGSDQRAWKATRFHVLGDSPVREEAEDYEDQGGNKKDPESADNFEVEIQECDTDSDIDSVERIRKEIRNAWGVAPNLAALLDTVSQAANDFVPTASGKIGAAVGNRQKNAKNEYLRAFTSLLVKGRHYNFTPNINNAMAAVATVVINDPDVVVTNRDVEATRKKRDKA